MTGAEVIIRKGNDIILGKVRFDGQEVEDFFFKSRTPEEVFAIPAVDLWAKYIEWRRRFWGLEDTHFSEDGPPQLNLYDEEIITEFDQGFKTTVDKIPSAQTKLITDERFEKIVDEMELAIEHINSDDGYLCGYTDYCLIVDYDNSTIRFVGMSSSQRTAQAGDTDADYYLIHLVGPKGGVEYKLICRHSWDTILSHENVSSGSPENDEALNAVPITIDGQEAYFFNWRDLKEFTDRYSINIVDAFGGHIC